MNGIALVTVKSWNSKDENGNPRTDKNGLTPLLLKAIAGKMPNRAIISGTIAESEGFEENKTYICKFTEAPVTEDNREYGRQFNFDNLGEVSGLDIIKATAELGEAVVIDVSGEVAETVETVEDNAGME